MPRVVLALLSISLLASCTNAPVKPSTGSMLKDSAFAAATTKWFSAWELVSRQVFAVDSLRDVDFVFFDDKYVYATSSVSVPEGDTLEGPPLLNRQFVWRRAPHGDTLVLPDGERVPVRLMSFAAPASTADGKPFFVMPLPPFWAQAGIKSEELGTDNLVTGVFLHEFSHSQQMQNFGKQLSAYETRYSFGVPFTDDIVQDLFDKDSNYVRLYRKEVNDLFQVLTSASDSSSGKEVEAIMRQMRQRQARYFTGKFSALREIEEFFLTMEGLGQFAMYSWFVDPRGAGIEKQKAIAGVRRGGRKWSQDEGFALFLLLATKEKSSKWSPAMFGDTSPGVLSLIDEAFKK